MADGQAGPLVGVVETEPEGGTLVTIPKGGVKDLFTDAELLDQLFGIIEAKVAGHVPDLTTAKGRQETVSLAFKVTKTKTYLDDLGKEIVTEYKAVPAKIDAGRKTMRDRMDAIATKTRQPVTDWESVRVQRRAQIEEIRAAGKASFMDLTVEQFEVRMLALKDLGVRIFPHFEELEQEAWDAQEEAMGALAAAQNQRLAYDKEQAELARLRLEAEERVRVQSVVAGIRSLPAQYASSTPAQIQVAIARLEGTDWVELPAADEAKAETLDQMRALLTKRQDEEAAKLEQARLDGIEAERKRKEAEDRRKEQEDERRKADQDHRDRILKEARLGVERILAAREGSDYDIEAIAASIVTGIAAGIAAGEVLHVEVRF